MNVTVNITLACSIVALVVNILNIVGKFNAKSEKNADINLQNEKNFLQINLKLDMFSQSIGSIKDNVSKTTQMLDSMQKKVIRMESDIDNHGEKLKDHEDRINRLEGR